jgi:PAS domain S-box-containing protein
MFGYESPEHLIDAIGDSASQMYAHPGDQQKLIRQILTSEAPLVAEVNFRRRDGSSFIGDFHGWKVKDTARDTFYLEGFIEDITERKLAENSLQESHNRLQFLSARLLSAQENEQRRISLEIHDDMGQDLALLKMHLIAISSRFRKDQQKLKDDINQTLVVIDGIIEKARNLSRDLNPAIIEDLKLSGALSWLINEIEKHGEIRISLNMATIDHLFSTENQIVIYRIIQEALKNIVKHAKARTVAVTIEKHMNCVFLSITDDGKGFDISTVWNKHVASRGLGLAAMDERGKMLEGTIDIQSTPGLGTCISLRIPIRKEMSDK